MAQRLVTPRDNRCYSGVLSGSKDKIKTQKRKEQIREEEKENDKKNTNAHTNSNNKKCVKARTNLGSHITKCGARKQSRMT